MKTLLSSAAALALALSVSTGAIANNGKKPENPGCFGQDRAAFLHGAFVGNKEGTLANGGTVSVVDDGAPGASRWGAIAGDRAEENGQMNRDYKEGCGGNPSDPS